MLDETTATRGAAPDIPQTDYPSSEPSWPNRYIWPVLLKLLDRHKAEDRRIFEIGSGNGATANLLAGLGYDVTAIDPSREGIDLARRSFSGPSFHLGTGYDDLAATYGRFPIVISLEVIEHCYSPEAFLRTTFDLLEPGGLGIISTPFHGYWKNLALSLADKWDDHHGPLWEGGHIKFYSEKTLARALDRAGFVQVTFERAGRLPILAKSMLAAFRRP
jgi:SAM-dependent methyltransferase